MEIPTLSDKVSPLTLIDDTEPLDLVGGCDELRKLLPKHLHYKIVDLRGGAYGYDLFRAYHYRIGHWVTVCFHMSHSQGYYGTKINTTGYAVKV